MEKIEILIVGTNEPIMRTIARLIDNEEKWLATIAFSLEEAIAICPTKDFKLALICAGLSKDEESSLSSGLAQLLPALPIVKHYGGGSGLLFAEIYQGLSR
jgi:hypothetical protein